MAVPPDSGRLPADSASLRPRAAGTTPEDATTVPARPAARPATRRGAPLPVAAAVTSVWAGAVSLAPVLALVLLVHIVSGSTASVGQLLRMGLAGWLLAHGVPLVTGVGPLRLVPLLVTALALWRVSRAGVHTTRAIGGRRGGSTRLAIGATIGVGVAYGLLGALVAGLVNAPGLGVSSLRAGFTLGVFGLVGGLAGALAESGILPRLAAATPAVLRDAVRTGLVGTLLLLGAGAATAGMAVALAGGEASRILSDYHTGVAGQAGLTLLCLVYAPNLAIWATGYLVGPGFAVGVETTVSVGRVTLGNLPAVPALAGLPSQPVSAWGGLLLGVPMAAGMVAGWLLARRRLRGQQAAGWAELLGAAALAVPVAGAALALAAFASGGPLGGGRLAEVGPAVWPTAGMGAALVGAGALVAVASTKVLVGVTAARGRSGAEPEVKRPELGDTRRK
jgi:Family of unknown function (DUF6350)